MFIWAAAVLSRALIPFLPSSSASPTTTTGAFCFTLSSRRSLVHNSWGLRVEKFLAHFSLERASGRRLRLDFAPIGRLYHWLGKILLEVSARTSTFYPRVSTSTLSFLRPRFLFGHISLDAARFGHLLIKEQKNLGTAKWWRLSCWGVVDGGGWMGWVESEGGTRFAAKRGAIFFLPGLVRVRCIADVCVFVGVMYCAGLAFFFLLVQLSYSHPF
ncbi:hypothetical protein B0T19DRAFT_123307 [Cercophora scortea]|uniref:Secreted protein n=1 Tax=Cercophora scortea TaxID=314031 RepID=A0AAE0IXW6_9PEZI|nr:hypothetical protein B0T19DRAFT_123307 [Cercophora scortea]